MKRYIQTIERILAALTSAVLIAVTGYSVPAFPVFAETDNDYDYTQVEEDLKDVDLSLYPLDAAGSPAIASFVEYCYTPNAWKNGNYALYVYVYNPSQKEFTSRAGAHQINIATKYADDGKPREYNLLPMKLCGGTTGKYDKLIYKFRVENVEEIYANAKGYEEKHGYRRYDVSNLLLYELGAGGAESCTVGREYKYTGYAKGYSEESATKATIKCEWQQAEVYEANVSHTNYRMNSEYKEHTRHEVNTVYFSIPDEYITDYGNLQGIRAQWYEYRTSPIFVTEDSGAYEALSEYVGVNIGEKDESLKWRVLWDETRTGNSAGYLYHFGKDYNRLSQRDTWGTTIATIDGEYLPRISWLFSTGSKSYKEYKVSREAIETWARSYAETYGKAANVLGRYAEELFIESIDPDRISLLDNPEEKRGKIIRDFDAGEEFNLLSYDDTHSGWDKFADYFGHWWDIPDEIGKTYRPILEIKAGDLGKEKSAFCKESLINEDDYDTFKTFCNTEIKAGKHPFVFRFAQTDYYSTPARFDYVTGNPMETGYSLSDQDGYVARQSVFLDFTMIHLKFVKEETETIIPVAMNPLDVWNGTDPPIDTTGEFDLAAFLKLLGKFVLGLVGLIAVLWLLSLFFPVIWTVIKAVFKAIWWIISAPFKWLAGLIGGKDKKN